MCLVKEFGEISRDVEEDVARHARFVQNTAEADTDGGGGGG